ncbi:MAG TPA: hypothetical protein VHC20_05265, partial [Candidatus Paceibacterota bacterium]|nr:hypothetical protein [Candidatus Paceibacterota bacterium]
MNANGVGFGASPVTLLSEVAYNIDMNVTGWKWSDGKARTIGYDSAGRMTSYTLGDPAGSGHAAGVTRTLALDSGGRIGAYTHTGAGSMQGALDQVFAYDNLDRLTAATAGGTSTSYSYDATGNRTAKTVGATTYTNTIASDSNRLNQTQDVTGTATIVHDAAGHITSDGTNTYTYGDRGRMSSATTAVGVVSFKYNGLEQRVYKTSPA